MPNGAEPFSQDYAEPLSICHLNDETGVAATDQTVTDSEAETGRYKNGGGKTGRKARQGSRRRDQKIKRDLRGERWSWTLNFAQKR